MSKTIKKDKIDEHFEKHMHDGHRGRVFETVNEVGIEHLSPIQKLEFILFYIFPRGDVNPLAHKLLHRFEHIHKIFDANVQDLMKVPGIGKTAAIKLRALLQIFDIYQIDKFNNNYTAENIGEFLELIEEILRFKNEEYCYVFGISPSGVIGNPRAFGKGSAAKVHFEAVDIASYIATYKVSQLIFVHNHPSGSAFPSGQDENTFIRINNMLAVCGVKLYDSFIVGRDGIYSWNRNVLVRDFAKKDFGLDDSTSNPKKLLESIK